MSKYNEFFYNVSKEEYNKTLIAHTSLKNNIMNTIRVVSSTTALLFGVAYFIVDSGKLSQGVSSILAISILAFFASALLGVCLVNPDEKIGLNMVTLMDEYYDPDDDEEFSDIIGTVSYELAHYTNDLTEINDKLSIIYKSMLICLTFGMACIVVAFFMILG